VILELELKVSQLDELLMLLPVGGSKVRVAPLTKLLPLIVRVWREVDPGIDEGDTLEIEGDGVEGAVTVKLAQPEVRPSGLVTRTCQVPASLSLLIW
jgi:hypothetical protein